MNEKIGEQFGLLTVTSKCGKDEKGRALYLCKCKCGNDTVVSGSNLNKNKRYTKSCGCLKNKTTHGLSNSRLYDIYNNMLQRCYNKNNKDYKRYGEKGIKLCKEWEMDFKLFYSWSVVNGYLDDLTIDRIDNSKGYSPSNCRWVSRTEQARNLTSNVFIEVNGMLFTVLEFSNLTGIKQDTIRNRLRIKTNVLKGVNIIC